MMATTNEPPTTRPSFQRVDWAILLALFLIHITIGLIYQYRLGVSIQGTLGERGWDWWWQLVPADLLRNDLWRSLWYMHSQPPLYNLYGAFFFRFFPAAPLVALQTANILTGGLLPVMIAALLRLVTGRRWLAATAGLLVALDPGPLLFEAYMLYDLATVFWVAAGACLLAAYWATQRAPFAVLFVATLCALTLTRSAYHLFVALCGTALVMLLRPPRLKPVLLASLLLLSLPLGWYVKNAALYGSFGASSWMGFGLWKASSQTYAPQELAQLADRGVIAHLPAEVEVLREPSVYVPYGYTTTSFIPIIGSDNRHNINMVAVAKEYQRSALRLIAYDPVRYLRGVLFGYQVFNIPSAQFKHLAPNAQKIAPHVWLYAQVLQGRALERFSPIPFSSLFFFLIPLSLLLYLGDLLWAVLRRRESPLAYVRRRPVETWIVFLVLYTTLTSIFLEIGENNREKFYIETLLFAYLVIVAALVGAAVMRRVTHAKAADQLPPTAVG